MSGQNIEIVKLQIKRGPEAQLPTLDAGEPAITTDTHKIFIGDGTLNHELAHKADLDATNVSLADITYNASNKGAKGDGITDDSVALTNWLNSNYNVISLSPNKTYYLTSPITITGINNKIIIGNGATIKYKGLEGSAVGNGGILNFINCNNITIKDLTIDVNIPWINRPYSWDAGYSNYLAIRDKTRDAFYFDTCDNIKLTNCTATNCRVGYFLTNVTNSTVHGCLTKQTMADSFYIVGASKHISVTSCHVQDGGDDCFSADGFQTNPALNPSYITFIGCTVKNTGGALICLQGSNYTQAIGCVGEGIRYVPIKLGYLLNDSNVINGHDQTIKDCQMTCTDYIDDSNGNISNIAPIFINGKDATNMANCYNLVVEGCTITKLGATVIPFYIRYATRFRLKGNKFINFNFKMDFVTNYDMEDNYIETPSFTILTGNTDGRIKDNYINNLSATDNSVLWLSEGNQMTIKNNKLVCANPSATEQLDLYSDTSCSDFKLSNNGNKVKLTNANNVQCDGVFMDYFSAPYNRFVVGQMVYDNTASTMKLVTATGYKTFTVA
jgi:hypothetical protein